MKPESRIVLGKVLACVAWADNELAAEEIEVIQGLVYSLGSVEPDEWARVSIYFEFPPSEAEINAIMQEFKSLIASKEEKAYALKALEKLIQADGVVTEEEEALYASISEELKTMEQGFFAAFIELLKKFLHAVIKKRQHKTIETPGRERNLIDFIHNPVFFRLSHEIESRELHLYFQNLDKQLLRKYSLMGAIIGAAFPKGSNNNSEFTLFFLEQLTEGDLLSPEAALLVAEIALNRTYSEMDMLRICREFFDISESHERLALVEKLIQLYTSTQCFNPQALDYLHGITAHLKVPPSVIEKQLQTLVSLNEIANQRQRLTKQ